MQSPKKVLKALKSTCLDENCESSHARNSPGASVEIFHFSTRKLEEAELRLGKNLRAVKSSGEY